MPNMGGGGLQMYNISLNSSSKRVNIKTVYKQLTLTIHLKIVLLVKTVFLLSTIFGCWSVFRSFVCRFDHYRLSKMSSAKQLKSNENSKLVK